MRGRNFTSSMIFALSALAVLGSAQPGWAKHKTKPQPSGDPCAAPTAYVTDHIKQIKALQSSASNSNSSLFDMLSGQKDPDTNKAIQISQLRYDADGVNALLQAGGCKAFDIDHELAAGSK